MRAIHIFPDTKAWPWVEKFRERFDPLWALIPAHLTLVFPFESPVTDEELIAHVREQTSGMGAFSFSCAAPVRSADDHYWLPVHPVPACLLALHQRLTTGPLAGLVSRDREYLPHITLARPPLPAHLEASFSLVTSAFPLLLQARTVIIERIEKDGRSHPVHSLPLEF